MCQANASGGSLMHRPSRTLCWVSGITFAAVYDTQGSCHTTAKCHELERYSSESTPCSHDGGHCDWWGALPTPPAPRARPRQPCWAREGSCRQTSWPSVTTTVLTPSVSTHSKLNNAHAASVAVLTLPLPSQATTAPFLEPFPTSPWTTPPQPAPCRSFPASPPRPRPTPPRASSRSWTRSSSSSVSPF